MCWVNCFLSFLGHLWPCFQAALVTSVSCWGLHFKQLQPAKLQTSGEKAQNHFLSVTWILKSSMYSNVPLNTDVLSGFKVPLLKDNFMSHYVLTLGNVTRLRSSKTNKKLNLNYPKVLIDLKKLGNQVLFLHPGQFDATLTSFSLWCVLL